MQIGTGLTGDPFEQRKKGDGLLNSTFFKLEEGFFVMKKDLVGFLVSIAILVTSGALLFSLNTNKNQSPTKGTNPKQTQSQLPQTTDKGASGEIKGRGEKLGNESPQDDFNQEPKEEEESPKPEMREQEAEEAETEETPVQEENPQPETIDVTLKIDTNESTKIYEVELNKEQTVYDLLKKASADHNFSLRATDYSFGVFIEEIAGVANAPQESKYWLYYLNGKLSSKGASIQKLENGDIVLWRHEQTE